MLPLLINVFHPSDESLYVYNWDVEHCPKHPDYNRCAFSFKCKNMTAQNLNLCRDCDPDVPDAPSKAFRRVKSYETVLTQSYETVLTQSVNWGSRPNVGPDLNSVKHDCNNVYYNKTWLQEPSLYASREWIQSPWAFDANETVVGLTHMEHHNLTTGVGDFSAVTLLSSNDGGRSWDRAL
eukprot:gene25903-8250_t